MKRRDNFFANRNIDEEEMMQEELVAHITRLTENQKSLMDEMATLRERPTMNPFTYFKTPDPIKNLSNFTGNKRETLAWIEEAEEALALFNDYIHEPIYPQLVKAVKSKIIGDAKEVLIAAGNPSSWTDIKECLLHSYGDKRDITSHIQSLFYVKQGNKTLNEYFNKIKTIDTAIKGTANSMEEFKGATKQINAFIGLLSTTRYIDGLSETLSMIVRSHKPESLEEAYTYAMQYSNAAFRQKLERGSPSGEWKKHPAPPANNNFNTKQFAKNKGTSGNFKPKNPLNEDISMRTARSKTQINSHLQDTEIDDAHQKLPDDSQIESDDDSYLEIDELNFHLVSEAESKT